MTSHAQRKRLSDLIPNYVPNVTNEEGLRTFVGFLILFFVVKIVVAVLAVVVISPHREAKLPTLRHI